MILRRKWYAGILAFLLCVSIAIGCMAVMPGKTVSAEEADSDPLQITAVSAIMKVDEFKYAFQITFNHNVVEKQTNWVNRQTQENGNWPGYRGTGDASQEEYDKVADTIGISIMSHFYLNGKSYADYWNGFANTQADTKPYVAMHVEKEEALNVLTVFVESEKADWPEELPKIKNDGTDTLKIDAGFADMFGRKLATPFEAVYKPDAGAWILKSEALGETSENVMSGITPVETATTAAGTEHFFNIVFTENISDKDYVHANYPISGMIAQAGGAPFDSYDWQKISDFYNWGIFSGLKDKIVLDGETMSEIMKKGTDDPNYVMIHIKTSYIEIRLSTKVEFDLNAEHTVTIKQGFITPLKHEVQEDITYKWDPAQKAWINPAVQPVIDAIAALSRDVLLTEEYKTALDNANNLYNALTDTQKAMVTNYTLLKSLTTKYDKLNEEWGEKVKNVTALIDALPAAEDVTKKDKAKINEAKAAYDALDKDVKLSVTNYAELKAALEALEGLGNGGGCSSSVAFGLGFVSVAVLAASACGIALMRKKEN